MGKYCNMQNQLRSTNVSSQSHKAVSTHIVEQRDIIRAILELSIQAQTKEKSKSRSLPVNPSSKGSPAQVFSRSMGRQSSWPDEESTPAPSLPSRPIVSLPMKPSIFMAIPPQHLSDQEASTHTEISNYGRLGNLASQDSILSVTQGKSITTADSTRTQSGRGGSVWTPVESTDDWDVGTGKVLESFLMKPIVHDLVDVIQLSWRIHKAQMHQGDVQKQISTNNQESNQAVFDVYQSLYDHEHKAIDVEVAKAGNGASLVSLRRNTSDIWHRDIHFKGVPGLQFVLQRMAQCTDRPQYEQHPVDTTVKPHALQPSLPVSEAEMVTSPALHSTTDLSRKLTETAATGASSNELVPDSTTSQIITARTRDTADETHIQVSNQPKMKRRTTFGLAHADVSKLSLASMGKLTSSGEEAGNSQALEEVDYAGSGKQTLPSQSLQVARPLRHKAKLPLLVTRRGTSEEAEAAVSAQNLRNSTPSKNIGHITDSDSDLSSDLNTNPSVILGTTGGMQYGHYFHKATGEEKESVLDEDDYERNMGYDVPGRVSSGPPMARDEGYLSSYNPRSLDEPNQDDADAEVEADYTEDGPEPCEDSPRVEIEEADEEEEAISSESQSYLPTAGEDVPKEMTNMLSGMNEDRRAAKEEINSEEEIEVMTKSVEKDESDDEEEEAVEDIMDEAEAERVLRELLGKYTTLFVN